MIGSTCVPSKRKESVEQEFDPVLLEEAKKRLIAEADARQKADQDCWNELQAVLKKYNRVLNVVPSFQFQLVPVE